MALPSPRGRPPFLICDADATIQALIAKEVRPFQALKRFQVQPVVVPAVLVELRSNHRYGRRVESQLRKALGNGTIRELDLAKLKEHFEQGQVDASAKALATATERTIELLGRTFDRWVDYGEAYSHAAALTLECPVLSHDKRALDALLNAGQDVPPCVLRYFDLLAFAYQVGSLDERGCDQVRSVLRRENEFIPYQFKNASFLGGLPSFVVRLHDGSKPHVGGMPPGRPPFPFANVLVL